MTDDLTFSERTRWTREENSLAIELQARRNGGEPVIDLTTSNPTVCGFIYEEDILAPLQDKRAFRYAGESFGLSTAREAVSQYYAERGAPAEAGCICLTANTSEAYSFLFKLLCNAGDEVLVASPSYPLFDYLAQLDHVALRTYPLHYDPNADATLGWSIDMEALKAAVGPRTRAIILVHPNNPTGHFVATKERLALEAICVRHKLALIVDEVFLDYAFEGSDAKSFAAGTPTCLTFILSGLSKVCALPQMKLSWILAKGPRQVLNEAVARLEIVADSFLSVNMPVQVATPAWLAGRRMIQTQILQRMQKNLVTLDGYLVGTQAQRLEMQAGWTTVVRVPRTVGGVPFANAALKVGVLVQPGELYGLPDGRIVLSLISPSDEWDKGLALLSILAGG